MDFAIHPLPDLSPFCGLVARSTSVHMYEGLPHQTFERELLVQELAAHATISLSSFPFYEGMMKLQDADARFLTEIFSASTPYKSHSPGKLCGGFHPDFAVEWVNSGGNLQILICFGCGELLLLYGPTRIHCDMDEKFSAQLNESLRHYRNKRPD